MKALITTGGKETRMKPYSNVMPKALLPLFSKDADKVITVPIIDLILTSLTDAGVSDFCIVLGQTGNIIKNYLNGRPGITYETQTEPKGFGDAVLYGEKFAGNDPFFIHAGDGVLTDGYRQALALSKEMNPDGIILVRKTTNPRRYGIATVQEKGMFADHKLLKITGAEEKPQAPKSDMMLSAVYLFKPKIFNALKSLKPEGDLELTAGINKIIEDGGEVYGLLLEKEKWLSVGDPLSYHYFLNYTFDYI